MHWFEIKFMVWDRDDNGHQICIAYQEHGIIAKSTYNDAMVELTNRYGDADIESVTLRGLTNDNYIIFDNEMTFEEFDKHVTDV